MNNLIEMPNGIKSVSEMSIIASGTSGKSKLDESGVIKPYVDINVWDYSAKSKTSGQYF